MVVTIPANGGGDMVLDRRDVIAIPDERLVFRIKFFDGERRILRITSSLAARWDLSLPDPDLQMRFENHQLRVAAARPALGVWIEDAEHGVNLPLNHIDQSGSGLRVVGTPVGQGLGDNHTRSFDTEMEFLPTSFAFPSMLGCGPLAFADD